MDYFSAGLVVFVAVFALVGMRSGLVHGSVTLLGLVVGLVVAGRLCERLGRELLPFLHTRGMSNLAAFLLILLAVWAMTILVGAFMREVLQGLRLGWLDNLGGMIFGAAKGVFLAEIIVLVLMVLPIKGMQQLVLESWLGGMLARLAPDFLELVPPVLRYWKPL